MKEKYTGERGEERIAGGGYQRVSNILVNRKHKNLQATLELS